MITLKFYSTISEGTLEMELSPLFPVPFNFITVILITGEPLEDMLEGTGPERVGTVHTEARLSRKGC